MVSAIPWRQIVMDDVGVGLTPNPGRLGTRILPWCGESAPPCNCLEIKVAPLDLAVNRRVSLSPRQNNNLVGHDQTLVTDTKVP